MAKIGYARVSSKQQNLDRQIKALEEKNDGRFDYKGKKEKTTCAK